MTGAGLREVPVVDGTAVWHARTVPELADAVRWLAGQLSQMEIPEPVPPDLSGYVPLADFQALQAQVTAMQGEVTHVHEELDALENRVAALETPAAP